MCFLTCIKRPTHLPAQTHKTSKTDKRALLVIVVTMTSTGIMHVCMFSNTIDMIEQRCISVLHQYQLENPGEPSDNPEFLSCFTQRKEEKRLSEISRHSAIFGVTFRNKIDFEKLFLVIAKLSFH